MGFDVENKVDIKVDQDVETKASVGANVEVETKPIAVESSFESEIEVNFPTFTAGMSGFSIEIGGIPIFGMDPFYLGTDDSSSMIGGLFFGENSRIPAYKITDKCIGCSTCARQCPTTAIFGVAKKRFYVDPTKCITCGTCGRACPVSAIVDETGETVKRVKPKEKAVPTVNEEECSGCEHCVTICPFNCLSIKPDESNETIKGVSYLEKPAKCVACGECANACAQEAITMVKPEPVEPKKVA